jgi:hypothetical protein
MPPPLLQTSNANERLQLIRGVWRWEWYTTEASDDTPLFSQAFICYDFGPHKIYFAGYTFRWTRVFLRKFSNAAKVAINYWKM